MLEPARCAGPSGGLTRSCTGPRRVSEPYKSATGKKPIASDNAAFAPRSSLRIEGNSVTFDIDLWGGVMYRANLLARYSLLWGVCSSCGCLLGKGRAEHPLTRLPPTRDSKSEKVYHFHIISGKAKIWGNQQMGLRPTWAAQRENLAHFRGFEAIF